MLSFGMCMCLLLSGFVFIFEELVYFVHALGEWNPYCYFSEFLLVSWHGFIQLEKEEL